MLPAPMASPFVAPRMPPIEEPVTADGFTHVVDAVVPEEEE